MHVTLRTSPPPSSTPVAQARVAISPVTHIGLVASGSATYGASHASTIGSIGGLLYAGARSGYYLAILGGTGWGRTRGRGEEGSGLGIISARHYYSATADYRRPFAQVNFAKRLSDEDTDAVLGLALRFSYVDLYNVVRNRHDRRPDVDETYIEPALYWTVDSDTPWMMHGQLGASFPLDDENLGPYTSLSFIGSFGVTLRLDRLFDEDTPDDHVR